VTLGEVHAEFTSNELLAPVMPEFPEIPWALILNDVPALAIVTLWFVSTPLLNAAVVIGAPASPAGFDVSITLLLPPLKLVTILLPASRAVMVTLKAVPAVCGLLIVENAK
jgi:hypothetical protein